MPASALPHDTGSLSRTKIVLGGLFAISFLYLRSFLLRGVPFEVLGDQQQFFARGARIFNGQVPFRDFFAFITPGTEYLYAAGFRIFGIHAWVMAGWSVAVGLAFCCLLTWIAARILPARFELLPALVFLTFDYLGSANLTHHWFSNFAALAAAAVLMRGITIGRIAVSSVLCAAATLCTQTAGVAAFLAIAIFLVWQCLTTSDADERLTIFARLAALCLPCAAILTVGLGLFIRAAGFYQVFFQLVLFAPRYFSFENHNHPGSYLHQWPPLHGASDLLRWLPYLFIYLLVPYVYAIGVFRIARARCFIPPAVRQNLMLLNILGIMLFLSVVHSPSYFRLSTIASPAIVVFVWLLAEPGRIRSALRRLVTCMALALAAILVAHRQAAWHAVLDLPIGRTALADHPTAREFAWLAGQTHPGQGFFNDSSITLYFALRNPAGLEYITHREFTRPEWVEQSLAAMRREPPEFMAFSIDSVTSKQLGDHTGPIRQFADQNYAPVASFPLELDIPYEQVIMERTDLIGAAGR